MCDPLAGLGTLTEFRFDRFRLGVDWCHDLRLDRLHPYYIPVRGTLEAGKSRSRARRDEGRSVFQSP